MKKKLKNQIQHIDENFIWHPFTQKKNSKKPIIAVSAKNEKIIDIDGNEYIDLISSWWVNTHGHAREDIANEIFNQAKKLEHVIFAGFTHPSAALLAKQLVEILPNQLKRVFYSDNGSTAVEIAMKVAIQYWFNQGKKKNRFIAFNGGYHGDTIGAMSVGFSSGFYEPFREIIIKNKFIPFADTWIGDNSLHIKEELSLKKVDDLLNNKNNDIAAVIIEPLIQGASGMKVCRPEFIDKVVKKFKSKNIIVIFDEVMTGFGRTGKMFASDFLRFEPDIICLAKSITAGYLPLAATVFSEKIHNSFVDKDFKKTFLHGHSYTANPVACSAALASIEIFKRENTLKKINNIEKIHKEGIKFLKQNKKIIKPRVLGSISAFDISGVKEEYGNQIAERIKEFFFNKGYILRPLGNTFYLMPPYCIPDKTLYNVYSLIDDILKKI